MTRSGTAAYAGMADLPPRVRQAVNAAVAMEFDLSCLPQQGQLLRLLAAGVGAGRIGETGTGCGVGLAWLASGAHSGARLVSVELDADRAHVAAAVFAADPRVTVRCAPWHDLLDDAPFDLLVLDGGGQGKKDDPPLDPGRWLRPGALVVLDDFTPMTGWPPRYGDQPDAARLYWLQHPQLLAAEIKVTPSAATIVATYKG